MKDNRPEGTVRHSELVFDTERFFFSLASRNREVRVRMSDGTVKTKSLKSVGGVRRRLY